MHTECFLCFPQKAQKSQNYARALLVLACIAGYFSRTQNTQNTQTLRIASLPLALIADNISLSQTARKAQNYARALLVLACIAGCFSGTQKYAKYADFCGLLRSRWPPDGFLFLTTNLHGFSLMHASLTRVMQGLFYSHTKSTKFTKAYAHCLYIASGNAC